MADIKRTAKNSTKPTSSLIFGVVVLFLVSALVGVSVMAYSQYKEYSDRQNETEEVVRMVENGEAEEPVKAVDKEKEKEEEYTKIYPNVFINDVDVGELTKEEALEKLASEFEAELKGKIISVAHGDKNLDITFDEFGAKYDFSESVDEAYDYAKKGTPEEKRALVKELETTPKKITTEPKYSYDKDAVQGKIEPFGDLVYIEPVNAALHRQEGKFYTTPGKNGQRFNAESTAPAVIALLDDKQEGSVDAIIEDVAPKYVESDFDNARSKIGTFYTSYSGGGGRVTNILNALDKINDTVVYPGEVFSTNRAFGVMTYDNGYRPAPVIVGGKLVDGLGGGVCQVSSTLYNALLYAELEIVERQNHSLKVGYTDYGFDATLAGDYIDLKFRNDTGYPVFIEASGSGGKVTVSIYGYEKHDASRSLKFTKEFVSTTPAGEVVKEDSSKPLGYRSVVAAAKPGYKYKVYKTVTENGKVLETVLVNTSTYKATAGEVVVGTNPDIQMSASASPTPAPENILEQADPVEQPTVPIEIPTAPPAEIPTAPPAEIPTAPPVEIPQAAPQATPIPTAPPIELPTPQTMPDPPVTNPPPTQIDAGPMIEDPVM